MKTTPWLGGLLLAACAALAAQDEGGKQGQDRGGRMGTPAKLLSSRAPEYPEAEKRAGHAGTVVITFRVGKAGVPEDLRVKTSSGYPVLDAAALDGARQWKFAPATDADGQVLDAIFEEHLEFRVSDDPMAYLAQPCARLVEEIAAMRAAKPAAALGEGKTFGSTVAIVERAAAGRSPSERAVIMAKLPAFYEAVYADCLQSPASVYEVAMKRHFDVLGLQRRGRPAAH